MNCHDMMGKMAGRCPCGSMNRNPGGKILICLILFALFFLVTQVGIVLGTVAFFRTF